MQAAQRIYQPFRSFSHSLRDDVKKILVVLVVAHHNMVGGGRRAQFLDYHLLLLLSYDPEASKTSKNKKETLKFVCSAPILKSCQRYAVKLNFCTNTH